jgi:hypothetical protein
MGEAQLNKRRARKHRWPEPSQPGSRRCKVENDPARLFKVDPKTPILGTLASDSSQQAT